jgi:hypothetical protein
MSKRKNTKNNDISADITAIVLILLGIVFSVIIYSKDLGWLGSFIKNNMLGRINRMYKVVYTNITYNIRCLCCI